MPRLQAKTSLWGTDAQNRGTGDGVNLSSIWNRAPPALRDVGGWVAVPRPQRAASPNTVGRNRAVKSRLRAEAVRSEILSKTQAQIFTLPFIYFFLNPVSLPEASNLLFNIGLYD